MKLRPLLALLAVLAALVAGAHAAEAKAIKPAEAAQRVADGQAVLVDVREPDEWAETGVAAPAELVPMSDFDEDQKLWKPFLAKHAGRQLILYCRTGYRAAILAKLLAAEGQSVANAGGFDDWIAAGLPVRQVSPQKKTGPPVSCGAD